MKRDIKLIGLDLDGTTLQDYTGISARVRASIERAIQSGIAVLPATGRQLGGIPPAFLAIQGVRYALTSNGAKVYDLVQDKVLYSDCFTPEKAAQLLRLLKKYELAPSVYIDGHGYAQPTPAMEAKLDEELAAYMRKTRTYVQNLEEFVRQKGREVEKIPIHFATEAERQRALVDLQARGDVTVTSSMALNLELNTKTANKGAGLLALGRLLGYSSAQIMAVGDGTNDIEMLRQVGWGVAMGNAVPAAKAVANAVTASYKQDGVAKAIDEVMGLLPRG